MINSFSEYLIESITYNGVRLEDDDNQAIPFGFNNGDIYIGNNGTGHEEMLMFIRVRDRINIRSFDYRGRLWINSKVIQFWDIPTSKVLYEKMITQLQDKLIKMNKIPEDFKINDCIIYLVNKLFDKESYKLQSEVPSIVKSVRPLDVEYRRLRTEKKVCNFTEFINEKKV